MPLEPKQLQPYYTIDQILPTPGSELIEYIATLSQAGTGNPTTEVVKDNITAITIIRVIPGQYTLTKTGAFPLETTTWSLTTNVEPQTEGAIKMVWTDANTLTIFTYNTSGVLADDVLVNTPIYIRKIL